MITREPFLYYKKNGENIPIPLTGISSPLIESALFDKIVKDFKPTLPMYVLIDGLSVQAKRLGQQTTGNLSHQF